MNFLSELKSWRVEGRTLVLVPHHPQGEATPTRAEVEPSARFAYLCGCSRLIASSSAEPAPAGGQTGLTDPLWQLAHGPWEPAVGGPTSFGSFGDGAEPSSH